jgi:hypothetical protein
MKRVVVLVCIAWLSSLFPHPASARVIESARCSAGENLVNVRHRIEGAINLLQRDTHYYGGHRLAAIDALSDARLELFGAEHYAITTYGDDPVCFPVSQSSAGSDMPWRVGAPAGGSGDLWGLRKWTDALIYQLNQDDRPYGGHRQAAINNLQVAGSELLASESFALAGSD